jgi:hypothetical protein
MALSLPSCKACMCQAQPISSFICDKHGVYPGRTYRAQIWSQNQKSHHLPAQAFCCLDQTNHINGIKQQFNGWSTPGFLIQCLYMRCRNFLARPAGLEKVYEVDSSLLAPEDPYLVLRAKVITDVDCNDCVHELRILAFDGITLGNETQYWKRSSIKSAYHVCEHLVQG